MNSDSAVPRCKYIAGLNQTKKAIRSGRADNVYLADDADASVRTYVEALCGEAGVSVTSGYSMLQLGGMCGIDIGCAVCAEVKA